MVNALSGREPTVPDPFELVVLVDNPLMSSHQVCSIASDPLGCCYLDTKQELFQEHKQLEQAGYPSAQSHPDEYLKAVDGYRGESEALPACFVDDIFHAVDLNIPSMGVAARVGQQRVMLLQKLALDLPRVGRIAVVGRLTLEPAKLRWEDHGLDGSDDDALKAKVLLETIARQVPQLPLEAVQHAFKLLTQATMAHPAALLYRRFNNFEAGYQLKQLHQRLTFYLPHEGELQLSYGMVWGLSQLERRDRVERCLALALVIHLSVEKLLQNSVAGSRALLHFTPAFKSFDEADTALQAIEPHCSSCEELLREFEQDFAATAAS